MKAQSKAMVASLVVLALALCAVSGATYSWFSDTEEAEISISTRVVDIEQTVHLDDEVYQSGTPIDLNPGQDSLFKIEVVNKSSMDVVVRTMMRITVEDAIPAADTFDGRLEDFKQNLSLAVNSSEVDLVYAGVTSEYAILDWTAYRSEESPSDATVYMKLDEESNAQGLKITVVFESKAVQVGGVDTTIDTPVDGVFSSSVTDPVTGKEVIVSVGSNPDQEDAPVIEQAGIDSVSASVKTVNGSTVVTLGALIF